MAVWHNPGAGVEVDIAFWSQLCDNTPCL